MNPTLRTASCALLLWAGLLFPTLSSAQSMPPVSVGDRVRVSSPYLQRAPGASVGRATGQVLRVEEERLVVSRPREDNTISVSFADLQRLEISRGRSDRAETAFKYGGIGLLAGGATGALLAYVSYTEPGDCFLFCTRAEQTRAAAIALGLLSGAGGMILGAISSPERWERVPLPGRVSFAPAAGGGLGLSITLRH